jgi:PAS domain S-box-containing protein
MIAAATRPSERVGALALPLLLLLLLLGTAYAAVGLHSSERWTRHTDDVRLELTRLQGSLVDAETAQRGYLATGEATFLAPYSRALRVWRDSFDRARTLTADNPRQQQRLVELEPLIEQKVDDLKRGVAEREQGVSGAALVPLVTDGAQTMAAIRTAVADMQREEVFLAEQRTRESVRREQVLFVLLFAAGVVLVAFGLSAWATRTRLQEADRARVVELSRALGETTRYRSLVESVNDATFILDPQGRVTTWNAAAERIKGYAAADIIGKHFSTLYPPEDVAAGKPEGELEGAAREGLFLGEGWRLRKDGTRFWADVVITAMRGESGDIAGFANVTRDLTDRMRNEQQLRRLATENAVLAARASAEKELRVRREFLAKSGEALASSLDYKTTLSAVANLAVPELADWCSVELVEPGATAPVSVAVAHMDPRKIEFVREMGERYPPDPNALTGAPQVIRTGKSELYAEIPAALLEAAARDGEHLRIIRELQLESGMVVALRGRARVLGAMSFVYANSGRRYTEADLAFAEDFARRAAMAIENAQAHAALSAVIEFQERFVAVLGHDLRNPLAAIDMATGILSQRALAADDAAATRVLTRIGSSSRRMSRMVEQILDLARSRLGDGLDVRPASMDMCVMLTEIVAELRTAHPSSALVLRCSSLLGSWDRDRLEQVFSNLISNAIHHGDAVSPVTIQVRELGDVVRVDVHNEGTPIPDELRTQLFSPFRRGTRDSRTAKTAGLGLGLYISHRLVAAHGGELDVQSSAAEGTTFRVTLPRTRPNCPSC